MPMAIASRSPAPRAMNCPSRLQPGNRRSAGRATRPRCSCIRWSRARSPRPGPMNSRSACAGRVPPPTVMPRRCRSRSSLPLSPACVSFGRCGWQCRCRRRRAGPTSISNSSSAEAACAVAGRGHTYDPNARSGRHPGRSRRSGLEGRVRTGSRQPQTARAAAQASRHGAAIASDARRAAPQTAAAVVRAAEGAAADARVRACRCRTCKFPNSRPSARWCPG